MGVTDPAELQNIFKKDTRILIITNDSAPQVWSKNWSVWKTSSLVHAKMMLLSFPKFLRVIISSSNISLLEWTQVRQVTWYQDFSLGDTQASQTKSKNSSELLEDMVDFFERLSVPSEKYQHIFRYDFSKCLVKLVFSVPQIEQKKEKPNSKEDTKNGFNRLKSLISRYFPNGPPSEDLIYQANTISASNAKWMEDFRKSLTSTKSKTFNLVYPTEKDYSKFLTQGTALAFVRTREAFPLDSLYRCIDCSGKDILLHSKCLFPRSKKWLYIGSHNLTRKAWGNISKNSDPQNIEIGVFFPPDVLQDFREPFTTPLQKYAASDQPANQLFIN
eukprot:TRINITY_DN2947_c0_g1_i3.p1 TRINITY_DN2947_c0_g1~~TRINITY_DN2947_c0_g1_i3.p1  ORF type:complete len:331 (-),score=38.28 TRINITY_DN2947_c0_g1_i3:61-1053(-)